MPRLEATRKHGNGKSVLGAFSHAHLNPRSRSSENMAIILVIDDEGKLRELLDRTLTAEGHFVHHAADGVEGCEVAAAIQPEVVLVDLWMPRREGLEAIRRIRQCVPEALIVAMSGRPMLGTVSLFKIAHREGADAALAKPFSGSELISVIDDLLAGTRNSATNGSFV
jgi:two-component system response regulator MprA